MGLDGGGVYKCKPGFIDKRDPQLPDWDNRAGVWTIDCQPCPEGFFSSDGSQCEPCTVCSTGTQQLKSCKRAEDGTCGCVPGFALMQAARANAAVTRMECAPCEAG